MQNNADALFLKGLAYLSGRRRAKNPRRALQLLEAAAEQNHADALYFAANMLENGDGVPFDRKKAFGYYQRAADLGNIDAVYTLGCCYMSGGMSNLLYSEDVLNQISIPRDEAQGMAYLKRAAAYDHKLAVHEIARHYYHASKDDPDKLIEAMTWYRKGISLGECHSMIDVADCHILGIGVEKSKRAARHLYEQAVRTDDAIGAQVAAERLQEFDSLEQVLEDDR